MYTGVAVPSKIVEDALTISARSKADSLIRPFPFSSKSSPCIACANAICINLDGPVLLLRDDARETAMMSMKKTEDASIITLRDIAILLS